jgi:hypothetical protein
VVLNRLVLVFTLIASLATSASATCMAEIAMNAPAQMACCKNGHDKCPMHGTAEDCCQSEGQRHQQVGFATHEGIRSIVSPPAVLISLVATSFVPVVVQLPQATFDRDVLKGPDPPSYLVGCALLV